MRNGETLVFLYHFSSERLEQIKTVLENMKIRSKAAGTEASGQKVGFLIGLKGFSEATQQPEGAPFAEELLIFHGFDRKRMDKVLAALREADVAQIQYKAVVTPYNMFWTLNRLGKTMKKEHGALTAKREERTQDERLQ